MKKLLKRLLKAVNKGYTFLYRNTVMRLIIRIKSQGTVSINEFKVNMNFSYRTESYYPAILQENRRWAKKIVARHTVPDERGLPTTPKGPTRYRPVILAQYGLMNYNLYLKFGDEAYKDSLLAVCDYLCEAITPEGTWPHPYDYRSSAVNATLRAPWCSSMVQGEAISCLVRGYHLTQNPLYLDTAEKALKPFTRPVEEGGVLRMLGEGLPMYEKYPTDPPSCILNGFLFSLIGLYDLGQTAHSGAQQAKELFEAGMHTLTRILPLYDDDLCSLYDLGYLFAAPIPKHKNPYYHWIHVNLLLAVHSIQPNPLFWHFINKWK
ncbi:MAG: hypothetical protein IJO76_03780 [Clostridia bacterium]|nr:hypothetical protein [Clostridia bacterium]